MRVSFARVAPSKEGASNFMAPKTEQGGVVIVQIESRGSTKASAELRQLKQEKLSSERLRTEPPKG